MRHLAIYTAISVAFVGALPAEAQTRTLRRNGEVLILNVRPRSYLDAGKVVPVGSLNFPTSGYGQTVSYLNLPPYFGDSSLDAALTATEWSDRILGHTQTVRVPLLMTWWATCWR